jgi:hypothetical protein
MAEQTVASLGQAVRRQVSFMNDAVSRALGRAGELEALVHNEVAALDRSYNENEHKIKGLIQELVGERHALVSTTDKVSETLKSMGSEVPNLIEKLSQQQIKLAKIIEGAGQNLTQLETAIEQIASSRQRWRPRRQLQVIGSGAGAAAVGVGAGGVLQTVIETYTSALGGARPSRDQMEKLLPLHGADRRHQPHQALNGVRGICKGARYDARQPRAGARHAADRADQDPRQCVYGTPAAVRRIDPAFHHGDRRRRRRARECIDRRHGEACPEHD